MQRHRYFVTGTDTDVGKTRVTAALARALVRLGKAPTVVKLVQTGLAPGVPGDAARAGRLAGCRYLELARYTRAADTYSAALAQGVLETGAGELADALASMEGPVVAEGAGGVMVPLNSREHFGHVISAARLDVVLAIGLRMGCLNHALLTATLCEQMGLPIAGAVLVERWRATDGDYRAAIARTLQGKMKILGILPFAADEPAAVEAGSRLFDAMLETKENT